jgi:RNA polymerase sigma-70 factor (ECF subfamily)
VADAERERFAQLFDAYARNVYAYARTRLAPTDAQDVVADTFLVAWRRCSDVPEYALPWLLVVARNTMANRWRRDQRQAQLVDAAAALSELASPAAAPDQSVVERMGMLAALAELSDLEREAVLLIAWQGLSVGDAARVSGCSRRAFEARLTRGRARLTRGMGELEKEAHR